MSTNIFDDMPTYDPMDSTASTRLETLAQVQKGLGETFDQLDRIMRLSGAPLTPQTAALGLALAEVGGAIYAVAEVLAHEIKVPSRSET